MWCSKWLEEWPCCQDPLRFNPLSFLFEIIKYEYNEFDPICMDVLSREMKFPLYELRDVREYYSYIQLNLLGIKARCNSFCCCQFFYLSSFWLFWAEYIFTLYVFKIVGEKVEHYIKFITSLGSLSTYMNSWDRITTIVKCHVAYINL